MAKRNLVAQAREFIDDGISDTWIQAKMWSSRDSETNITDISRAIMTARVESVAFALLDELSEVEEQYSLNEGIYEDELARIRPLINQARG